MFFKPIVGATILALAATTQAYSSVGTKSPNTGKLPISRPDVKAHPYNYGRPHPPSPPRKKVCFVKPGSVGSDAAPQILSAFHDCNNGGTVVLDANYTIASPLDLTFLNSVDIAISGRITFLDDIEFWIAHTFQYAFQAVSSFLKIGGKDVNIFGGGVGVVDGLGETWWLEAKTNTTLQRPILWVLEGIEGGTVSQLNFINPPNWFNFVANSSDLIISDMSLQVIANMSGPNSDGWDTYRSEGIVIQNSVINNGDDCVSFKPNSTNIVVQGLQCNGSHGISVGSLGQYVGEVDIVENVYVYNNSMTNAGDGARIKVWPGVYSSSSPILNGGGGSGYVKNITYEHYYNYNNDWAIELNQCYGQSNVTLCELYPSLMTISDVWFKDFWGTTSKKYDPKVGTLVCSSPEQCFNIYAQNISITPPSGNPPEWVCNGFNTSGLEGFDCVSS
ncbi:polygalacturonase [Xylariales sp. PMI_506]|nr:polygalacturonase [Xylariales sp. PMI_506]